MRFHTERLQLEPITTSLSVDIYRIHSDLRAYQHRPDLVMQTPMEAEQLAVEWADDWGKQQIGYCAVRLPGQGIIGFAGVRVCQQPPPKHFNLYYRFAPEYQGQGFAFEAAKKTLEYAEKIAPELAVWAVISPANPASKILAVKLGLRREESLDFGPDDLVYRKPPKTV